MNDQTQEIALAKGGSKVRGPFMATCSACGGRYWPGDKENHLAYDCFPSPYRMADKAPVPPPGGSAGERWRLMKKSSLKPAERKALGLAPRRARKSKQR
jgi:hypothetical protein